MMLCRSGSKQSMSIKITPEDGTGQIIWESDDENVLTVDDIGTVYAVGNGKAKVIAKTIDGSVESSFEITVYTPVTSIAISKQSATIFKGDTLQLIGNVLPEDASSKQITWSSENEAIATVSTDGLVTAIDTGKVNIIASIGEIKAICQVTVMEKDPAWVIEFDQSLRITGDEISNLPWEDTSNSNIRSLINTNLDITFDSTTNVGTGTNLTFSDAIGNEVFKYQFVLYGDVNGDGLINSLDVLVLQKYILEIKSLNRNILKSREY